VPVVDRESDTLADVSQSGLLATLTWPSVAEVEDRSAGRRGVLHAGRRGVLHALRADDVRLT
jgi:hypothetical protein